jgi:hypothetical protein
MADVTVRVPADRIELVEDAHLAIAHSLCVAVREQLWAMAGPEDRTVDPSPLADSVVVDLTA